ncbi:protein sidekick-1-like [Dendronephthya gigantea]|uniref:protein sidekick-1-like n=1 Tax=Dendronephthya gigantea TaxID=151771 RepID=UPI00106CF215|nr:protein sidekick-1-like [Dendronephthya gigantea]XP_028400223.1 protein sidekick-1-like [Dendronephthya gigantea]XP_028400225.1 protein sidekick-1-like [Dendronephthya gigantea]
MQTSQTKSFVHMVVFIAISVFYETRSEKPVIIKRPTSQNVYINQSAIFVCHVQSNTEFVIGWIKNDKQLLRNVTSSSQVLNDSLTIAHARRRDAGTYTCRASNAAGVSSAQATLTVLDPPVAPTITEISPKQQAIVEGNRVTFTCKASGYPPPRITWEIFLESGDDNRARLEKPSPNSIRISSVSPIDTGRYVCIAKNDLGNDTQAVYLRVLGYPVFTVSPPSNITVKENETIKLNCKVIGSPPADVNWYYGNVPVDRISNIVVQENNTLQISNVQFDNRGTYSCVANNSAGLKRFKTTLLKVLRAPKLDCCPTKLTAFSRKETAIEGLEISLDCSSAGYPEPTYRWMFENNTISSDAVLTLRDVSTKNEGVYSCKARNNLGEVMLIINLTVLVPPKISIYPRKVIIVPGEHVTLSCSATGVPLPAIMWYSPGGTTWRNGTLVITNTSKNDEGDYICQAKNKAGKKTATASVVVAVLPTLLTLPRNITANESTTVVTHCVANGPDRPIISWFRLMMNGRLIKLNSTGNELIIVGIDRDDSGFYVCEARNHAGFINVTFFINVQYSPDAAISIKEVNIVAGGNAVLLCPINANPEAEIRWITPVHVNVTLQGHRLTISKVDISHAGRYRCRGKNALGVADVFLQVQVMTQPRIIGITVTELSNDIQSVTCVTTGTPKPVFDWIDLNEASPPGPSFKHNGSLLIEKNLIKTMRFICNASNVYGWTTALVAVPSSPYNFTVTKISARSIIFTWLTSPTEIVASFIVERRAISSLKWVTISSSVVSPPFEDNDIPPFTTFTYRVSAKNALGTSLPGDSFNASTTEEAPSFPSKLTAKSLSLTSITIYWQPPREPNGPINDIVYEIVYEEKSASTQVVKRILVNDTRELRIPNLKSNTLYLIKIRAGRQTDNGTMHWSDYRWIHLKTLQKAPTTYPKEIEGVSNGPRRIHVTWKRPLTYVEGYKLQYKEYEMTNATTVVIDSWNTSSYMITGLIASRFYEIQMNMFTNGGDGPWSVPTVVHTDTDRLAYPGPISSTSDSLPWKIAVGGVVLAVVLLLLLFSYIYLTRKSKHTESSGHKRRKKKKSRNQGGYDFTDSMSGVSNESIGSTEGVYNVNAANDHIDLAMFENSYHTAVVPENMYVENPILPTPRDDSDDSDDAVRLATFIARPSPLPTRHLTDHCHPTSSHVNPAYEEDEYVDIYSTEASLAVTGNELSDEETGICADATVDLAKMKRDRENQDDNPLEQVTDDILI